METLAIYILPLLVIVASLAARPLRLWLERLSADIQGQSELVDKYQHAASRFLKNTDPEKHAGIRQMVVWVGRRMVNGTFLIDRLVFAKMNGARGVAKADALDNRFKDEFESLSDEAAHAMAQALGAAICLSAAQSIFRRERYSALLGWVMSKPTGEVNEPMQVVYRYRQAAHLKPGDLATR